MSTMHTYHVAMLIHQDLRKLPRWYFWVTSHAPQPFWFDALCSCRGPIEQGDNLEFVRKAAAKMFKIPEEDSHLVVITSLTPLGQREVEDKDPEERPDANIYSFSVLSKRRQQRAA